MDVRSSFYYFSDDDREPRLLFSAGSICCASAADDVVRRFCRLVYNLALQQRRAFHRQFRQSTGRSISYVTQARELTELRAQCDWIRAVSQTAQQQALRDLDAAYQRFFDGLPPIRVPVAKMWNTFRFQGARSRSAPQSILGCCEAPEDRGGALPLDEGYCRNCQERHGEPYRSWLAHQLLDRGRGAGSAEHQTRHRP